MGESLDTSAGQNLGASPLIEALRSLIQAARQKALRAVDAVQVQTCWEIGRHIVESEQAGASRAEYGRRLLQTLAAALAAEFGRGFDASNLRYMRLFHQVFPICDALRLELSWTHYRILLRVESEPARLWYLQEAASQGWTTRALERQISTLYYERLLTSSDRNAVEREAGEKLATLQTPRDFVRDPVMLEFLGLLAPEGFSKPISNERCSTTCRRSCSSLAAASRLCPGSIASVASPETSTSISSSTTTC